MSLQIEILLFADSRDLLMLLRVKTLQHMCVLWFQEWVPKMVPNSGPLLRALEGPIFGSGFGSNCEVCVFPRVFANLWNSLRVRFRNPCDKFWAIPVTSLSGELHLFPNVIKDSCKARVMLFM